MNTDDTDQESGAGNQLDLWQQEEEGCSMAYGALYADGTAVIQNNVLHDCQAKPSTAAFARTGFIHAIEALKDTWQMFRSDARAEVAYKEFNAAFALLCAHNDAFSALGIAQ